MVGGHEGLVRGHRGGRLGVLRHWGEGGLWVRGHCLQTLVVGMLVERVAGWEVARSTLGQVVWPEVGRQGVRGEPGVHPHSLHHRWVHLLPRVARWPKVGVTVWDHVILLWRPTTLRPSKEFGVGATKRGRYSTKLRGVRPRADPHVVRKGVAGVEGGVWEAVDEAVGRRSRFLPVSYHVEAFLRPAPPLAVIPALSCNITFDEPFTLESATHQNSSHEGAIQHYQSLIEAILQQEVLPQHPRWRKCTKSLTVRLWVVRSSPRGLPSRLGLKVDHPPAGLARALVLHPDELVVQRQVVPDRVLGREGGELEKEM